MPGYDDYFNNLRYGQLFGNGGMPSEPPAIGIDQMMPMGGNMMEQPSMPYQPEHTASDFLSKILATMPERHKASMMDRIFAGIAGLGGPAAKPIQDDILNGDFNQQMQDWQAKAAAGTAAANMERSNNTLAKSAYDTNESRKITQQRADEYVRRGDVSAKAAADKAANDAARTKIEQQKADVIRFNADPANGGVYSWHTARDGTIFGLNNKTAKAVKTDIKAQDLNDIEKHQLKLDEIAAAGEQARETKETVPGVAEKPGSEVTTSTSTADNTGKVTTTSRTQITKPVAAHNNTQTVMLYGPQGQGPYPIPADKVDDAIKNHQMSKTKPAGK